MGLFRECKASAVSIIITMGKKDHNFAAPFKNIHHCSTAYKPCQGRKNVKKRFVGRQNVTGEENTFLFQNPGYNKIKTLEVYKVPFYGYYFDSTWLLLLPAVLLSAWAQWRVSSAYNRYSKTLSSGGWTAAAMARRMLDMNGLGNVQIISVPGNLTDHYDPKRKVLALSDSVYGYSSLAALGVAAHEVGHAIQHDRGYQPLAWRSSLVPVVNIGSRLSWPLMLLGILMSFDPLVTAGIVLFSLVVVFQLVTLPVEFNASSRALIMLETDGYLKREELGGAKTVLQAAALTYVAGALSSLLQLLRLILISNRRSRR